MHQVCFRLVLAATPPNIPMTLFNHATVHQTIAVDPARLKNQQVVRALEVLSTCCLGKPSPEHVFWDFLDCAGQMSGDDCRTWGEHFVFC